jgi:hypothetical protein
MSSNARVGRRDFSYGTYLLCVTAACFFATLMILPRTLVSSANLAAHVWIALKVVQSVSLILSLIVIACDMAMFAEFTRRQLADDKRVRAYRSLLVLAQTKVTHLLPV